VGWQFWALQVCQSNCLQSCSSRNHSDPPAAKPTRSVWISKDFRFDLTPRASRCNASAAGGSNSASRWLHWRRGHWHTVLHGEKPQSRRMQWFQPVYVGLGCS
jgi:hypothetical protein